MRTAVSTLKINSFKSGLIFLTLLSTFTVAADDEKTAKQWLERMIQAVNNLDYQGTFIYLHDNQLETMKIVHAVENGQIQERLISLNGAPREVIRDQNSVTCFQPESEEVSFDRRPLSKKFLALLPDDLGQLDDHYSFRWLGKGRVAGRHARVIAIIPKDGYRYGYRFFLDEASALPLKSDLMNERGKAVEQTMFTHLDIGIAEIDPAQTSVTEPLQRIELSTLTEDNISQSSLADKGKWEFHDLPDGFSLTTRNRLPADSGDKAIEQYVLSDGLASLSVFVESAEQNEANLQGVSRLGAINAWGGKLDGFHVTIVGEVPAVTLLGIVDAMRLKR